MESEEQNAVTILADSAEFGEPNVFIRHADESSEYWAGKPFNWSCDSGVAIEARKHAEKIAESVGLLVDPPGIPLQDFVDDIRHRWGGRLDQYQDHYAKMLVHWQGMKEAFLAMKKISDEFSPEALKIAERIETSILATSLKEEDEKLVCDMSKVMWEAHNYKHEHFTCDYDESYHDKDPSFGSVAGLDFGYYGAFLLKVREVLSR